MLQAQQTSSKIAAQHFKINSDAKILFDEAAINAKEMFDNASERTQAFVRGTTIKLQGSINDTNLKLFDAQDRA